MKIDKEVYRAMVLIELCSKEAVINDNYIVFSSLNLFKTFKLIFKYSNSVFYNIFKLLTAFEVIDNAVGEKILNKLKWNYFKKRFPNEYSEALSEVKRIEILKKGGINEKL